LKQEPLFGPDPVNRVWCAFEQTRNLKQRTGNTAKRFADLVPLVRFALEQQPMLEPFAESVHARFESWLAQKSDAGTTFTDDQRSWLDLIRDHIATSLSIEPEDFNYAPFNQRGGLGRAYQIFGDKLIPILEELNLELVA
jgi:type I restriction enzyme R subunit